MSLIIIKRNRKNHVKRTPTIKFYPDHSYFTFSYKATEILDVERGDGVMFGFNFKTKSAFIFKDNSDDSFKLNKIPRRKILKFGSTDLKKYFIDCFKFEPEKGEIYKFELIKKGKNKFELKYLP